MNDMEVLFPEGKGVTVAGETLTVTPFKFGQLSKVTHLLAPIVRNLTACGLVRIDTDGQKTSMAIAADWPLRMVELMGEGGEDLLQLIAYAVGKPRAWLDTIEADQGIELGRAVVEVNADFFAKRILPMLQPKAAESPSDGDTSSASLSAQDTAEATSTATP